MHRILAELDFNTITDIGTSLPSIQHICEARCTSKALSINPFIHYVTGGNRPSLPPLTGLCSSFFPL